MKKLFAVLLSLAMLLSLAACGTKEAAVQEGSADTVKLSDGDTVGEGKTAITVEITDGDGKEITVTVHTDEKTVGEALEKLGIIRGEEGDYGIYIKTVNQETHIYEEDGMYWAFYINGEYAATGADMTAIDSGAVYGFKAEKG